MEKKINLLNLHKEMLQEYLINIGEKIFIADQIMIWIYKYYCFNFFLMKNIKLSLRFKLHNNFEIILPKIIKTKISFDGVIKLLLISNNNYIETIYIPKKKRRTLCISTQVGCSVNCSFCHTGKQKFKRNLCVSEIIGQILCVSMYLMKNNMDCITNIVIMGTGEPLLNFINVINSVKIMLDKNIFSFSKRKIVLSTSGVVPYIYELTNVVDIILAISLHASNDKLRSKIMLINKQYNINSLLKAAFYYVSNNKANKGKIHVEYIMLEGINDSIDNAHELISLLANLPSKVNLIPFNKFKGCLYKGTSKRNILLFNDILNKNKIFSSIRKTRGLDINASCGQLSGIYKNF